MVEPKVRVSAIQMNSRIGDWEHNIKIATNFIREAKSQGSEIICLPELFNTGYFCHVNHVDAKYFELAESTEGKTIRIMQKLAKELDVNLIIPFFEREKPGVFYNSAAVISNDGDLKGAYRKTHIPWSFTGWEKFYFRPGYSFPIFNLGKTKIGIAICYDREFPETVRTLAIKGAEIIFLPSGVPGSLRETWTFVCRTRAYENQVFVVGVGQTGKTDSEHYEFAGHSIFCDPFGRVLKQMELEEACATVELNLEDLNEARTKRFMFRDRKPELYQYLTDVS